MKAAPGGLRRFLLPAILFAATILGLSRIRLDSNVLDLLPPELAQVRGLKAFLEHFGLPRELIIAIETSDAATTEALSASLEASLRDSPDCIVRAAPPWNAHPEQLAEVAAHFLLNQPPDHFRETLRKLEPGSAAATAAETIDRLASTMAPEEIAILGYDPLGLLADLPPSSAPDMADREFVSADGKTRLLYVTPAINDSSNRPPPGWVESITSRITDWQQMHPDRQNATVGWTGEPAFVHEISTAMSGDMRLSSLCSLAFAALIFLCAYRSVRPLGRMFLYVICSFTVALGLTALVFPGLSIISVGFAAILVGITVDYGFLLYQRRLASNHTAETLRAACAPSILAAAATTSAAFLSLNLSGLPGVAQLGTTVAIGVAAGAFLMLRYYAADLAKIPVTPTSAPSAFEARAFLLTGKIVTACVCLIAMATLLLLGMPAWCTDTQSMKPRNSIAYPTLDRVSQALGGPDKSLSIVIEGATEQEVADKLSVTTKALGPLSKEALFSSAELPAALWPNPAFQKANLAAANSAAPQKETLRTILSNAGFTDSGTFLTAEILNRWDRWNSTTPPLWPDGEAFQWIARRTMGKSPPSFAACGIAVETGNDPEAVNRLINDLASEGIYLTSWPKLGEALAAHTLGRGVLAGLGFLGVLFIALLVSFRNLRDPALVLACAVLGLGTTAGLMRLLSLEWNFMNLCSLTLIVGVGVDYSIHMIFALRENHGNESAAFGSVGKALALCAATTIVGFGSLATAQTQGLASLGINCALGISASILVSLFLLPTLWRLAWRSRRAQS